jgi:hypothetical protein
VVLVVGKPCPSAIAAGSVADQLRCFDEYQFQFFSKFHAHTPVKDD